MSSNDNTGRKQAGPGETGTVRSEPMDNGGSENGGSDKGGMDKSLVTNLVALVVTVAGLLLPGRAGELLAGMGIFALSGAVTNWLAVHMLFERVPGFYGSGVIPARFTEFKQGIRALIMEQFFNPENVRQFFAMSFSEDDKESMLDRIMARVDFNQAFDGLVEVIMNSKFAGMLSMVGGEEALRPLREPFANKMREFMHKVSEDTDLLSQVAVQNSESMLHRVEAIVDKRLDELTPELVKEIVQHMIRRHLGWLVVWGGVVGGLMGLLVTLSGQL